MITRDLIGPGLDTEVFGQSDDPLVGDLTDPPFDEHAPPTAHLAIPVVDLEGGGPTDHGEIEFRPRRGPKEHRAGHERVVDRKNHGLSALVEANAPDLLVGQQLDTFLRRQHVEPLMVRRQQRYPFRLGAFLSDWVNHGFMLRRTPHPGRARSPWAAEADTHFGDSAFQDTALGDVVLYEVEGGAQNNQRRPWRPQMFREVLVPYNGGDASTRALEIGAGLAQSANAELRILAYKRLRDDETVSEELVHTATEIGRRYELDPHLTTLEPKRFLSDAIVSESMRRPGSIVCMAAQGRSRTQIFTGSVSSEVMLYGPRAVVLCGPECERVFFEHGGPMIAALDGTDESEAILPVADHWASSLGLLLEVVTVLPPEPEAALASAIASGDVIEGGYLSGVVSHDTVFASTEQRSMSCTAKRRPQSSTRRRPGTRR